MLKILPPKLPQIFDPLFLFYSHIITPIIPTYSCNFYCISDNNVHNTHSDYYTGEQDIDSADFLQNLHEILLPSWTSSPSSSF